MRGVALHENRKYVERSYFSVSRLHKLKDRVRHLIVFGETTCHLISELQGHIAGPAFGGVESDYSHRIIIFAGKHVADHCLAVSRCSLVSRSRKVPFAFTPSTIAVERQMLLATHMIESLFMLKLSSRYP